MVTQPHAEVVSPNYQREFTKTTSRAVQGGTVPGKNYIPGGVRTSECCCYGERSEFGKSPALTIAK
jgi:hypothetical protein